MLFMCDFKIYVIQSCSKYTCKTTLFATAVMYIHIQDVSTLFQTHSSNLNDKL
jgi:hypothetical protein